MKETKVIQPPLPQTEIDKIKAEELLKYKIRKQLQNEEEHPGPLWKWLNSPFILLIFSAGVLSFIGQIVSYEIQANKDASLLAKDRKIHVIEFDNRIAELDRITSIMSRPVHEDLNLYIDFIARGDMADYYKATQPEFKGVSLVSLISWFRINGDASAEQSDAYQTARTIYTLQVSPGIWDIPKVIEANKRLKRYRDKLFVSN